MSKKKRLKSSINQSKFMINGFIFPQLLLDDIRLQNKECTKHVTASALAVYLTMLSKCDELGYVDDTYNLAEWSRTLDIPYSTLNSGRSRLLELHFVKEVILNGYPVYKINNFDKYMEPERHANKVDVNYFRVPFSIFKTNILKKLVHSSSVKGILFFLQLLNQFRTKIGYSKHNNLQKMCEELEQDYTINRLKKLISPSAKKVREVLDLITPFFLQAKKIEHVRGEGKKRKQIHLQRVFFIVGEEIVQEKDVHLDIESLLAKYRKEFAYQLINLQFKYNRQDLFDSLNAFKQEVVRYVQYIEDKVIRNTFIENVFFSTLDNFQIHVQEIKKDGKEVPKIQSIGAYFRSLYRVGFNVLFPSFFMNNRGLIHDSIQKEFHTAGEQAKVLDKIKELRL